MIATALIRVRFPLDVVKRLDALAAQVGAAVKRKVPRAAMVRALVKLGAVKPSPELASAIYADTVKCGRAAGRRPS